MTATILLVEDDRSLRETLTYNLQKQEYSVEVASDGLAAVEIATRLGNSLSLMILDLMLPKMDGFEVCRTLRAAKMNMPILMLTARDDEIDRVVGLEIGADDYITKPFSMRELLARVKTNLRRESSRKDDTTSAANPNELLCFDNLTIDLTRREVQLNNLAIAIKPKEYELLVYLARHKGQALTRERLLEQVWGWDFAGGTRTVDVHIRWLREKLEAAPDSPTRFITVRGSGYRFEG